MNKQPNLFEKLKDRSREKVWKDRSWLVNVQAFTPAVCVLILLSLAPYLVNIAADCPPANQEARTKVSTVEVGRPRREQDTRDVEAYLTEAYSRKGNPLFCKTENWWRLFKLDFDQNLARIRQGWSESDAKSMEEEIALLQDMQKEIVKKKSTAKTEEITTIDGTLSIVEQDIVELQNKPRKILAISAKEASGRLYWISSLAILFVTSAVVTLVH
jgi:hypothetical protein